MGVRRTLKERLEAAKLRPSTRRGQNFLIDSGQLAFIVEMAGLSPGDSVLEVGPGTGFLTRRLAASGCTLFGVELDFGLLPLAREETASFEKVLLVQGDILDGKNRLNAGLLSQFINFSTRDGHRGECKCVSNLPYSIATPFIINLLASPLPWILGVFLLQKEAAERLLAAPGSGGYGALSICAALAAETRLKRIVPPAAFWPVPKVDSAVVTMAFRPMENRLDIPWRELRSVTNAVFGARRKTLRNAVKGLAGNGSERDTLIALGVNPDERGENLRPEEFLRLARHLICQSKRRIP
ncbi:MAG: 16S rRNA (adenine(1518)-N(6)/adenine(1519)-N(6))-dimethyltransferase RsmA [Planctomycetota bacterium]|nr:16S rRNA (adenine(1518)-N(6)/adenine(1519)-N(6))-dimethyltransferase RsmA [Planctomycetota bacterium]